MGNASGFTEIAPGKSAKATIGFYLWQGSLLQEVGDYPPYRLQAEVFVGTAQDGRLGNVKKCNLMIDVENGK